MLAAEKSGTTPEAFIQPIQLSHERDFTDFGVDFDEYHTTHSEENRLLAESIYARLRDGGHIARRSIQQLFDPVKEMFLPTPDHVLRTTVNMAVDGTLWEHALSSLQVVLLGFVIGSSRMAYAAMYPLMTGFNALPKAAFVPILVVWFGIGVGPAVLTAFLISFFPITVNIATGLATLEPELEDVLRVLGAKRWDVLIKIGLPRSMPYFYASLKVAITLAFVGTTVSEMTAANEGIGYLLISAGSSMQMGLAFAGLLVVGAMAMAMYELFAVIEKRTTGWAHRGSNA
jgi:NitT/TauT family transport system permease protein